MDGECARYFAEGDVLCGDLFCLGVVCTRCKEVVVSVPSSWFRVSGSLFSVLRIKKIGS